MRPVDIDEIYRKMSPEQIPWNIEAPPSVLVELVERGTVRPCKAIDFGCGVGHYAIYLALRGFDVTGVDISPTAISMATENARRKGAVCRFLVADVVGPLHEVKETFDFAYDWELLHHLFPEQRPKYVENVYGRLNPQGRYLSVCFSEEDPHFGGSGKYRQTPLGTVLYFSSEDELRSLFGGHFHIEALTTIRVSGKSTSHVAVCAWMQRRS